MTAVPVPARACVRVPWSEKGGAYVEVCGAGSVRPEGYLCVPLTVSARQLGLFRPLHVDIDACIMSLPQGGGSDEPGILIGLPSLLESGLLTSVLTGESNLQRAADSDLDADPIEQWETMGRDEIGDTVQSVNQGTAFTMPKVDGSDAEKAAIWSVLNKYKQVFGPPPLRIEVAANVNRTQAWCGDSEAGTSAESVT
jgi:hypothetical protein